MTLPAIAKREHTIKPVIVWFRRDLRLDDNPALQAAQRHGGPILPLYILEDGEDGPRPPGGAARWWLHRSLESLNSSLAGRLRVLKGDPLTLLPELVSENSASAVFWNRCHEHWQIQRDRAIKGRLGDGSLQVNSFNASLLWEPWEISKESGGPYRVFTPFFRNGCLKADPPAQPSPTKGELHIAPPRAGEAAVGQRAIDALELLPGHPWYRKLEPHWQPGEQGSACRLSHFIDHGLDGYREGRDFPAKDHVSRLSPHLHFGEISPRRVWHAVQSSAIQRGLETDLDHFHSELGWREFSWHLLYHNPGLPHDNIRPAFDHFPWRDDRGARRAWQRGETGYPLVDAGMRELWQTGYMHNRLRMVTASFLVKNLMQHWHHGEAWFRDTLVDADRANNSNGWQWVAGSGADAAPYFRIFNPVTQSRKFDPQGDYIRRYVPEIAALPDRHLHDPGSAPTRVLEDCGIRLGRDYPAPMIDLKESRQAALDAYQKLP